MGRPVGNEFGSLTIRITTRTQCDRKNMGSGKGKRPAAAARRSGASTQAGEIRWLSLDPTKGHEQAGFRPVVVLSPAGMNGPTRRIIGVPVT